MLATRSIRRVGCRAAAAALASVLALSAVTVAGAPAAAAAPVASARAGVGALGVPAPAAASANLDFESGVAGWTTTGTVTASSTTPQHGTGALRLAANSTATVTITGLEQGSYTLSGWFRGAASNNVATLSATGTGGPDSVALIDAHLGGTSTWVQTAHRNVLVYNGRTTITLRSGSGALEIDDLELSLDSADTSLENWGFESGLDGWTANSAATLVGAGADSGTKAVQLAADGLVEQTVAVEPNTRYGVSVRAKVARQDEFSTEVVSDHRGALGELVHRESTGDRVNLGVKTPDGTVLRQAPSGTTDYSLVTVTFETGPDDTEVVIYANTIKDAAYDASVTLHDSDGPYIEDPWTGNGTDAAVVDNANLFVISDENNIRGADVSFLPVIEDKGGKYFANGVQQDCLRILSNHGQNSVMGMVFVESGQPIYDYFDGKQVLDSTKGPNGEDVPYTLHEGYFDEVHSTAVAVRATALGMSYMPSFHYSDGWVSAAKAYTPVSWMNQNYDGTRTNTDVAHIKSIVYNYVYDFVSNLVANGVDLEAVKQGNEQNGGLIWPIGQGGTSSGHAAIIAATYDAVAAAAPGVARSVHNNNGYATATSTSFYGGLVANGAKLDAEHYSLYGGRSSGNILKMAASINADPARRYRDYVNVETGFSFTKYKSNFNQSTNQGGQTDFYRGTANGQYNWLLDYQQAALDVPNPYGATRGFYYWETDWIPTPWAGWSSFGGNSVANRIMFNNGDPAISEMGSARPGKAGDMMDSMYAHLIRGGAKAKPATLTTPLNTDNGITGGAYAVTPTEPTGISIAQSTIALTPGRSERIKPTVTPIDQVLTDSVIRYASADPAIASVTSNGFVTALAPGGTTVTATDAAGHVATVPVTVTAPVVAAPGALAVTLGTSTVASGATVPATALERLQLSATIQGATEQSVVYTSSDPAVASFFGETRQTEPGRLLSRTNDSSTVQLNVKKAGSTLVTVTTVDGGASTSFTVTASAVPVASVTLDKTELTIGDGRPAALTSTVAPSNATFYKVTWTSSDESIATVDAAGLVTPQGVGDVTVSAVSTDDPSKVGSAVVHVLPIQVTGVVVDKPTMTVQRGTAKTLSALVLPAEAGDKTVTWSSSDEAIATVDAGGSVTGVGLGVATITATSNQGGFTASTVVTVQENAVAVTGVTLDLEEHYFESDFFSATNPSANAPTVTPVATVSPADATSDTITWTSDTPEVATVNAFGIVTAVAPGVAVITATGEGGLVSDSLTVFVPTVSESFDNRAIGDAWGTARASGHSGVMSVGVVDATGDHVLSASGSGSGARAMQKEFSPALKNDLIVLDFEWNVGAPGSTNGSYVTITDSASNRYLSIQTRWASELVFSTGGTSAASTSNIPLSGTTPVGTGFAVNDAWYDVHVEIDNAADEVEFTITRKDDPSITATHTVPLPAGTAYTGDVSLLQFWGTRASTGTLRWTTLLDEVNAYLGAAVPKALAVNASSIKLIPIEDTRQASFQLAGSVTPAGVSQELVYTSEDPSVATVSSTGLVTPATLYSSLSDVDEGATTIRVAAKNTPTVFVDVPVRVTSEINASEFFWVESSDGTRVSEEGQPRQTVVFDAGDTDTFLPRLTGGDGDTDVAGIAWTSSDPSVVTVDPATGRLEAVADGTASVDVVVSLYAGEPKRATVDIRVGAAPTLTGISVTGQPSTVQYDVGEAFDAAGLEVTAAYSDGSSVVLGTDAYTLSGFDSSVPGTVTVTVALVADPSATTSFTVTVSAVATGPAAPTGVAAVAAASSARVGWTASGAATGYTVTSAPGGKSCTTAGTSCVVGGLTNGTAYTFTVVATNVNGSSAASAASASITPSWAPGSTTNVSVTVSAKALLVGGKPSLAVHVLNKEAVTVTATIETALGSKSVTIAAGQAVYSTFPSSASMTALAAGAATITVTKTVAGALVSSVYRAGYAAVG